MSKPKKIEPKSAPVAPSQLVWSEERLAALDKKQLANLLDNLHTQQLAGRVSEATAQELAVRIRSRLPKPRAVRRKPVPV